MNFGSSVRKRVRRVLAVCCATFHMVAWSLNPLKRTAPVSRKKQWQVALTRLKCLCLKTTTTLTCLDQQTLLVQAELVQPQQSVPPGPAQQPPIAPAVQQVTVGLDLCYAANDVANDAESADYAGNAEQAHGR